MRALLYLLLCAAGLMWSIPAAAQPEASGFVEAFVDNPNPYVGERITYTFRLYDAGSTTDKRYLPPEFVGFWQQTLPHTEAVVLVDGVQHLRFSQDTLLYAAGPGPLVISPARILIPETPFQRGMTLATESISINVRPLPPGAPERFNGLVGQFQMEISIEDTTVTAGLPFTLTMVVTGSGNLEQMRPPVLPLPAGWRSIESTPLYAPQPDNPLTATKTFRWSIIPGATGQHTLPAMTLSYFDPLTTAYTTLNAPPLMLDVAPGSEGSLPQASIILPDTPTLPTPPALMDWSGGAGASQPGALFWLLWLLPPLLLIITLAGWRGRGRQVGRRARAGEALPHTQALLQRARNAEPREAYAQVHVAICDYFARRLGRKPEEISRDVIEETLSDAAPALRKRVLVCFEQSAGGRYAPVMAEDVKPLIKQTLETLLLVEKTWQ